MHPLFNIKGLKDNGGILSTINGISTAFTAGMSFTYNGDNNYIDKIEPQNGSYTIFKNASPLYDVTMLMIRVQAIKPLVPPMNLGVW